MSDQAEEFESRVLCPKPMCLGVLAEDGRCSICQTVDVREEYPENTAVVQDRVPFHAVSHVENHEAFDSDGDDFSSRVLCRNPHCLGVLRPDGTCNVCNVRI